ncbi:hypothetical protein [Rhodococcus jostii]
MEDLAQITHENVQLGVRDRHELVFVERIRSKDSVPLLTLLVQAHDGGTIGDVELDRMHAR